MESGQKLARKEHSHSPLMYEWHDKKYLGAAHGLAGIFFTLMQYSAMNPKVQMQGNTTMKQLDVDVSPPAFVWNLYSTLSNVTFHCAYKAKNAWRLYLTLVNVTFDLDSCDL